MAKGRMLLKRISMSEKVNKELSCDTSRLLYTWLLSHLDCNGCYYADPIIVKNTVFPWREDLAVKKIESYLNEMANCGLILVYESDGLYLFFPDFEDKQPKINKDREGKTDIPPPTQEQIKSNSRVFQTQSKIKEDKVKEDKVNVVEIISYLNKKAGTKYRTDTKDTVDCIRARANEGYVFDDFISVLNNMDIWLTDPKMINFYRPQTLFGTKFQSYLNSKKIETESITEELSCHAKNVLEFDGDEACLNYLLEHNISKEKANEWITKNLKH